MKLLSRVIAGSMIGGFVGLPYLASQRGWGVQSERNASVIRQTRVTNCPTYQRDAFGNCRRSHRSYFGRRSYVGGGHGYGK